MNPHLERSDSSVARIVTPRISPAFRKVKCSAITPGFALWTSRSLLPKRKVCVRLSDGRRGKQMLKSKSAALTGIFAMFLGAAGIARANQDRTRRSGTLAERRASAARTR